MIDLKKILSDHKLWLLGLGGQCANLYDADLREVNLEGVDLREADLRGVNLYKANLRNSNLSRSNLEGAYLHKADLRETDLRRSNLERAELSGSNLRGAHLPHFQICPEEGSFIGWKKVSGNDIVKLLIPKNAKRTSTLIGRKCRAEFVVVLKGKGASFHNGLITYKKGETVYPDKYDDDIRVECTHGIHFFMTKREAEEY